MGGAGTAAGGSAWSEVGACGAWRRRGWRDGELKIKDDDYTDIYNHTLAVILVEYASAENELGRPPSEAEMFIETRKKKIKPQGEKTINLISALEELKSQDEVDDAWDLVKKDEHPGRVHLMERGVTKTMLQNKNKKIVDIEQVPEYAVQTISQKVEQELTKKFEAQKADLVHGFAELLTETLGQTIDPAAIARLVARTRSPEEGNSARNHDRPRSSGSSHHPRNEVVFSFVISDNSLFLFIRVFPHLLMIIWCFIDAIDD
ncbi:uncharacterized protein A4U43_C04F12090 [Asparagus officinalis]|uniref:Uncharacterized protein n=1 Tax=Asparagus officinalis TaxID=4686 RepID=A0A5P1F519_ASPOF|nr:uncharacterized protein A4U43_C04F12090 [Asparagus officinalis]